MESAVKWIVFAIIAISGTVANIEVWSMWTPHSYRGHVWVTREPSNWPRVFCGK